MCPLCVTERATELAAERGLPNAKLELCDALDMKYEDNTFDFVWACESGECLQALRLTLEPTTPCPRSSGSCSTVSANASRLAP